MSRFIDAIRPGRLGRKGTAVGAATLAVVIGAGCEPRSGSGGNTGGGDRQSGQQRGSGSGGDCEKKYNSPGNYDTRRYRECIASNPEQQKSAEAEFKDQLTATGLVLNQQAGRVADGRTVDWSLFTFGVYRTDRNARLIGARYKISVDDIEGMVLKSGVRESDRSRAVANMVALDAAMNATQWGVSAALTLGGTKGFVSTRERMNKRYKDGKYKDVVESAEAKVTGQGLGSIALRGPNKKQSESATLQLCGDPCKEGWNLPRITGLSDKGKRVARSLAGGSNAVARGELGDASSPSTAAVVFGRVFRRRDYQNASKYSRVPTAGR
jgi:hypothetical protein